jgi:hypothetical protein
MLQALANVAVVFGIAFLIQQTRAANEAAREARLLRIAEIFKSINEQFDDITSNFPPEINKTARPDLVTLRHHAEQRGFSPGLAERAIWRYHYMVRTEFELCRMGVLTDHMWRNWLNRIITSFEFPAFCEIWEQHLNNRLAHPRRASTMTPEFDAFMNLARNESEFLVSKCGTVQGLRQWVADGDWIG